MLYLISVLIGFAANRAEETQERRVVAEWNAALRRPILQWCNGAYCPLISVVLGNVIDIGESNWHFCC